MVEDILKGLRDAGFKPELVEDDGGFEPVNGKYVVRIDSAGRKTGESKASGKPYDFRTVKVQVAEVVSGDKATNRYFDLAYNPDVEGTKKLLNDLHTSGIDCNVKSDEELDEWLPLLKDQTMNLRAWVWSNRKDRNSGEKLPDRQMTKVVKDFSSKKKADKKSDVPF